MPDDGFAQLQQAIEDDWRAGGSKFPDQAVFALRDERCADALRERSGRGLTVVDVRETGYDGQTGLVSVCFAFEQPDAPVKLAREGVLVVLRAEDCSVVAVVAPSDPDQPNPMLPPPPAAGGESPFVVSRPSGAGAAAIPAELLGDLDHRVRRYLASRASIWGHEGHQTNSWVYTGVHTHGGVWDQRADSIPDDCGPEPF